MEPVPPLPQGVPEAFIGMVWAARHDAGLQDTRKVTYLRTVLPEPGGVRALSPAAAYADLDRRLRHYFDAAGSQDPKR